MAAPRNVHGPRAAKLLPMIRPRLAHPLRGLRADLATLARKLEDDVDKLCAGAAAHEDAGDELEAKLNQLRRDMAQISSRAE